MTVVEISECFPNKYKSVTGEFILQHVRALSKHCNVITIVPLRFVPAKELFSLNPVKSISNVYKWFTSLLKTKNTSEGNLRIIYFRYISLPRPYFESTDNYIINFFFYNKVRKFFESAKPDLIYCNWLRPWAELSVKLSLQFDIPFVIDHHEDIPTLKKIFPDDYKKFLSVFEKADEVIVHSSVNKNDILNENLSLPNISVSYLGQNFSINNVTKKFNFNKLKLICVSHLYEKRKSIDILIKALALIKIEIDFELKIVGDGILKEEYAALTNSLNLQNKIHFTGEKSQEEVNFVLNESDIFILPSYPEAFGVVFIEALAKGLPVITCEGNGGGEELKKLGYPVVLVKPGSPEDLSKAILDLSVSKDKMDFMSVKGKEIVEKYFTWEKNGENTFEILDSVINKYNKKR